MPFRLAGRIAAIFAALLLCACNAEQPAEATLDWHRTEHGVITGPGNGEFRYVRLQLLSDDIIRVTATPQDDFDNLPDTLMIVAQAQPTAFDVQRQGDELQVVTAKMAAVVSLRDGSVRFEDPNGSVMLAEAGRSLAVVSFDPGPVDEDSYAIRQRFRRGDGEAYFGLGQQQDGRVNYADQNIELTTHNLEISMPFLVSSRGYGVLWNNTSITHFGDPLPPRPLAADFKLFDAHGEPGGLTARYYQGDMLLLERVEADPDYQYLAHGSEREHPFPVAAEDAPNLRIEWLGSIVPKRDGLHELKMYSSGYATLTLDGSTLLDRWRQNWNPWYHNATLDLQANRKYALHVDWRTQGGYFRLLQYPPRPQADAQTMSIASDTGKAVDYYYVAGKTADQAISGYRRLTGKATLPPKWSFGFWQSRERYKSQQELVGILEEYRARAIPIDNIVLDWSYWPVDAWGSHDFDPEFFPDPQAMVDRVHALDARIMISVWPKFYPGTDNYKALDALGCMFNKNIDEENRDWIGPGYLDAFYDAFDPACRKLYWQQVRDKLNVYGFDAWWLDAVEPDMHSNLSIAHREDLMTPNALGTGAEYFNAYALPHAESVYRGERETDPGQRSFILTRSGFAGIQRTGSAVWSGDIVSRWSNLREQIAAGIGVGLAGMPWWTFDIGGFTPEDRYRWAATPIENATQLPGPDRAEWQELNLRWFQFAAFVPLFRSHGQNPYREIFNLADKGSDVYDSLVQYTRLRYRLLPYIYSLAGDAWRNDGTMMRGLVMDFAADPKVFGIATQYLFGPALLVNPVYESGARSRSVYLPAGSDWYDFYSGERYVGGTTIDADAPLVRMPLFVRAGSIIPTGPAIQHTGESLNAPLLLNVYTGADGQFDIYEDDGVSYRYEDGQYSRIPIRYDDRSGTVEIGRREGGFDGMAADRIIGVRWIDGADAKAADFDAPPDMTLEYSGAPLSAHR
jgi:alpha-D-xyloside xylohydrolase